MRINSSGVLTVGSGSVGAVDLYGNATVRSDGPFGINNGSNKIQLSIDRINFNSSIFYILNESSAGVRLNNGDTSFTTQSDETLKENIVELSSVLPKVKNLRCVSYNLKSQTTDDVKLGFIAQDWQGDFPQVVNVDPSDGKLGMTYTETIPVLMKAIQEQQTQIETLQAEVAGLKGE